MDLSTKQGRREQGLRIQSAVERAGLSIEELAGRIGCSRALIYQYLAGSTLAQPDRLQQIAGECGVALTYFYQESEADSDAAGAKRPDVPAPVPAEAPDVAARIGQTLRTLNELADAQEGPPEYRALAATCERALFLAGQLGDRAGQARLQFRLGNACLRTADFPRAAEALKVAIQLAIDVGDTAIESDARQSLGNVLISMGNLAEARDNFLRIASSRHIDARWKGTLSLGSVHTIYGEYREAMESFDEAAAILEEGRAAGEISERDAAIGLLYVNGSRTNVYLNGGDFQGARPLIEQCLVTAESYGIADEHLEARFDLAWCDFHTGRWAAAYRGLNSMLQLARFVGDQGRETMARAWLGILLAAAGDYDGAISHGRDALSTALSRGDRRSELYAQLALADAYTGHTMRESEARYHTNQAVAVATSLRMDRGEAECRIRSARLCAQIGDSKELVESASRAAAIASRLGARHLECLAVCWQAQAGGSEAAQLAASALKIAENIGLSEGRWRAEALLAATADPGQDGAVIDHLSRSVAVIDGLRAQLVEAGLADTLLENDECIEIYASLIKRLNSSGDTSAASALLEHAGWPPLETRLAGDASG